VGRIGGLVFEEKGRKRGLIGKRRRRRKGGGE
jgi:hypothetical protein